MGLYAKIKKDRVGAKSLDGAVAKDRVGAAPGSSAPEQAEEFRTKLQQEELTRAIQAKVGNIFM